MPAPVWRMNTPIGSTRAAFQSESSRRWVPESSPREANLPPEAAIARKVSSAFPVVPRRSPRPRILLLCVLMMPQTPSAHAGPPPQPTMTLAEWADMDEDAPGELVDGMLVEDEDVGYLHDAVGAWLTHLLFGWVVPRGGLVAVSDARFGVAPQRGRKPDISVYFKGRRPPAHGLITMPPDLMVEVVSPRPKDARRDRVEKMNEYATFGVRYYWLVDPALRTLEIFELGVDGRYTRAVGVTEGVVNPVPGCEGLSIDLDPLWALIEGLEKSDD